MFAKSSLVASLVFALGALSSASAAVIHTYSNSTLWTAATTGITSIPFSTSSYGSSLSLSGATFTSDGVQAIQVVDTTGSLYWGYGTGYAIEVVSSNVQPIIHVTLAAGVTSFGLNLTTVSPYGDALKVTAGGVVYNIPSFSPTGGGFAFFGATFDAPITSFDVTGTATDFLFIDNVSFGTQNGGAPVDPSPTPEVATLLMIGTGLIGMRTMSKRMHFFGV